MRKSFVNSKSICKYFIITFKINFYLALQPWVAWEILDVSKLHSSSPLKQTPPPDIPVYADDTPIHSGIQV